MKIAISTDGDSVSPHFGRCSLFTIVDIENGEVIKKESIENPGHHPGYIPEFLRRSGVDCIVTGGMGMRATELFNEFGIQTIVGISGKIEEVIDKLLEGTLQSSESTCKPGLGRGYGLEKTECDNPGEEDCEH